MKGSDTVSIAEIVQVEVEGLSQTICEYTSDNYISSYAKQLLLLKYPDDKKKMSLLVDRLIAWYVGEINTINKDPYIRSKEAHNKSYQLLLKMQDELR